MRRRKTLFFLAGVFVLLTAGLTLADGEAVHFNVPLDNLGTPSEPGTGVAIVTLAEGNAQVEMQGLQSLPHDSATGQRIRGYAAWLVNSEDALSKLNMGFLHTFTLPQGTPFALFNYHCTPHRLLGMTGRIFVRVPPQ
jgi:plastocyanin